MTLGQTTKRDLRNSQKIKQTTQGSSSRDPLHTTQPQALTAETWTSTKITTWMRLKWSSNT